ncbi:MAG: hypothetical protein DME97_03015 [Verrucomicrobia bacterium]|nr:MAG: hypothetical protein DME97_03015 [Verrucomicrobiota bacterium]
MAFDDRGETGAEEKTTPPCGLAPRLQRPADIKSVALIGLFVLAVFYTMYFMRAMLLPLVLALLLSYLLVPLVRVLAMLRIRPLFGAAIVLVALIGAIGYGISFLSEPAASWIEKAPYSLHQLQQKLRYMLIAILEGNFITPMILGRSLTLNPVLILIALALWGWMWGISGMILAVPILATFKIFCDHIESMAPIAEFMT